MFLTRIHCCTRSAKPINILYLINSIYYGYFYMINSLMVFLFYSGMCWQTLLSVPFELLRVSQVLLHVSRSYYISTFCQCVIIRYWTAFTFNKYFYLPLYAILVKDCIMEKIRNGRHSYECLFRFSIIKKPLKSGKLFWEL